MTDRREAGPWTDPVDGPVDGQWLSQGGHEGVVHDGKRLLLSVDGQDLLSTTTPDGRRIPREHLVHAVGVAYAWLGELRRTGDTISDLARRCKLADTRVHLLLALTQLSPDILKQVLTGTLPATVSLDDLVSAAQHLDWSTQQRMLLAF